MKTVEMTDAKESLATYAAHRKNFPLIVTEHGRPVVALLALGKKPAISPAHGIRWDDIHCVTQNGV